MRRHRGWLTEWLEIERREKIVRDKNGTVQDVKLRFLCQTFTANLPGYVCRSYPANYIWSNCVYFMLFQMTSPQAIKPWLVKQSTFIEGISMWRLDTNSHWPESILLSLRPSSPKGTEMCQRIGKVQMPTPLPGASATLRPTSSRSCCHARKGVNKISIIANESPADISD